MTPLPTHVSHSTLVAHYSFDDGTAAEDSDGRLDGTISGAVATTGRDGSGALAFDGTDDYVEFPDAVTADVLGSSARTICLWAVIGAFDKGTIFSYDSNSAGERFSSLTGTTTGEIFLSGWGTADYEFDIALSGSDDGRERRFPLLELAGSARGPLRARVLQLSHGPHGRFLHRHLQQRRRSRVVRGPLDRLRQK